MAGYECNLVLVHTPPLQARSDFEVVRAAISERAPDIEVFIADNRRISPVTVRQAAERPAVVFSPVGLRRFRPRRGKVFAGIEGTTKTAEAKQLVAAGVRTPDWVVLQPDTRLDPETWGPFTVVKPDSGRQGKGVRLWRTRDVRWVDPMSWPGDDRRYGRPLVAQRFVDTGPLTTNYRVMTVFGRVVFAISSRMTAARPFDLDGDLDGNDDGAFDHPIAATGEGRVIVLCDQADVLDFAREAAGAFPEVGALGIDIVREQATGLLYALEVNQRGGVWHLSSRYWANNRQRFGLDLYAQFGAIAIIAKALIDVTRREAV